MSRIAESELIINDRGAIYHLDLRPEEIADTVITVGDPDRVQEVSKHFDTIEVKRQRKKIRLSNKLQTKREDIRRKKRFQPFDGNPGFQMVGVEGFELSTSCSQSKRATGLRHTPNKRILPKPVGGGQSPVRKRTR